MYVLIGKFCLVKFVVNSKLKELRHFLPDTLKYWVGIQRGQCYSWGGASVALIDHPSSDGVTIKIPLWGRCFTTPTNLVPHLFLLGWLKLNLILLLFYC